jgi:hypothetical protein
VDHRRLGIDLFNHVWTLLEKPDRTREEDFELIHTAHASRYHWGRVGTPANLARGEWQISRVYATLGRVEPALFHAERCLQLCQANEVEDWDLPFAYEALARAYAVAGDAKARERYQRLASEEGEKIADDEDRELLLKDLATLPKRGAARSAPDRRTDRSGRD